MTARDDTSRFHIEEYLEKYGARRTAIYLLLFMGELNVMHTLGLRKLANLLHVKLDGTMPQDMLYRYSNHIWHVGYTTDHEGKVHCFECVQNISDLLYNEKNGVTEKVGKIENDDTFLFTMELCMPSPKMMFFKNEKYLLDNISLATVTPKDIVLRRLELPNLEIKEMEEIKNDFIAHEKKDVELKYGTALRWLVFK